MGEQQQHMGSGENVISAFSRSSVAIVLTDPNQPDNPIIYVNEAFCRLTGYDASAAVGRNCRFLQGPETDRRTVKRMRSALAANMDIAVDILNYRADGSTFMNRLIIAPVQGDTGKTDFFLGIQKRLDEELMDEAAKAIEDSLTELQHRVKNHLSMIIGLIRSQSRGSSVPSEFNVLARRVETLQLLYEELLTPHDGANEERVLLGTYLTRIANAIAHLDGRPGIRIHVEAEDIPARVESATRVGLVVSEVLTNAFQHAFVGRDTGLVEFRMVRMSDGGARVTVSDDGVGMAEDVEWPDRRSLGGRIVMGLIEGLGGSLNINNGANGTMVTIEVPATAWDE